MNQPPVSQMILKQIPVPGTLHLPAGIMQVGQYRITGAALIRAVHAAASRNGNHMIKIGASFCCQQVIPVSDVIDVRGFQKTAAHTAPNRFLRSQKPARADIYFLQGNFLPPRMQRLVGTIINSVPVKQQGRIDPSHRNPDRRRPFPRRILRRYNKIPILFQCCRHIKSPLVPADCGRPDTTGILHLLQREFFRTGGTISYLRPIYQILTVKNRDSRKILKGTGHQVIILSYPANTRVRMKAFYNRIFILHMISLLLPLFLFL